MPKRPANKTTDAGVRALRVAMAIRGWSNADLAGGLGVSVKVVTNNFSNDFSSKLMRQKVNALFEKPIFLEGIGV